MKAYRVMMQRIGGHNTLFTTVEAEDEFQALNEANTTWGSHYKLIHIGEVVTPRPVTESHEEV